MMVTATMTLRECILSYNQLTDACGEDFIRAAKTNGIIEKLDITCNLLTLR